MFIVGIDVAKRNHEVAVITPEGQVVCKGFRISNTCTGYNRMMERLGKLTNLKSQFIFAMEFTAHCWLALYTCLRKGGYQVVILNPIQTHTMREMFLRKSKTDAKDFLVIANANLSKLTGILWTSSNGHLGEWKAQEMKTLARNSFGIADCEGAYSTRILLMLEQIHTLQENAMRWKYRLERCSNSSIPH